MGKGARLDGKVRWLLCPFPLVVVSLGQSGACDPFRCVDDLPHAQNTYIHNQAAAPAAAAAGSSASIDGSSSLGGAGGGGLSSSLSSSAASAQTPVLGRTISGQRTAAGGSSLLSREGSTLSAGGAAPMEGVAAPGG